MDSRRSRARNAKVPKVPNVSFSMMVPTFRRPERLPPLVAQYATGAIPSLRRIVIMWHDDETEPATSLLQTLGSYKVPVVLEHRGRSLNERFRRSENVQTDCILSIDDDLEFSHADVELGYQTWKEFGSGRQRMIGYMPREVSASHDYSWSTDGFSTYRYSSHLQQDSQMKLLTFVGIALY